MSERPMPSTDLPERRQELEHASPNDIDIEYKIGKGLTAKDLRGTIIGGLHLRGSVKVSTVGSEERSHELLDEFTSTSSMTGSAPVPMTLAGHAPTVVVSQPESDHIDVPASVIVEATGKAGRVHVLHAETGKFEIRTGTAIDPKSAHPPPVEEVPLFDGPRNAVAWLPDAEARKVSLKRISDDSIDLQIAYFEGRTRLVAWRKLCLWVFLGKMFLSSVAMPIVRVLSKMPAWLWAFIVWLKPW